MSDDIAAFDGCELVIEAVPEDLTLKTDALRRIQATVAAGAAIAAVSFVCILWLVVRKYLLGSVALGWTSIIASIWCVGGLIIFCLGVVSLYTARIFDEVKHRPYAVVRRIYATADEAGRPLAERP